MSVRTEPEMLRANVLRDLKAHGIVPSPEEGLESLRERLNEAYLGDVRELRTRQRSGEIPLRDYASHVQALKERYPLLGLPLSLWSE